MDGSDGYGNAADSETIKSFREQVATLERELAEAQALLRDWAHAARFGLDSNEQTLAEIIRTMRNEHCAERSIADLHASGGLPEAMQAACEAARA